MFIQCNIRQPQQFDQPERSDIGKEKKPQSLMNITLNEHIRKTSEKKKASHKVDSEVDADEGQVDPMSKNIEVIVEQAKTLSDVGKAVADQVKVIDRSRYAMNNAEKVVKSAKQALTEKYQAMNRILLV
jgi:hypothetical protein